MKVKVALGLSTYSNAKIVINATHYINSMTGNAYFTSPETIELLKTCKTRVANLQTALNAPKSETKKDDIQMARNALDRNLTMLGANVEEVANDPSVPDSKREEIVHSAGMRTKHQGRPGKHVFSAKNTNISGKVHLTAEGGANAHQWQYTTDVKTFTELVVIKLTTVSYIDIEHLKRGTEYAFFHKSVKPRKDTDWEGPIILMVT